MASGAQIGFTVRLTNNSSFTATGLTFTDNLPAAPGVNWSIDAANSDAGWSVSGSPPSQSLVYSPTTLAGGTTTRAHVISATTVATCGSTLNNMASYAVSNGCPGSTSGSASASVTVLGTLVPGFSENFDGVTPPALPPGWVATNAVTGDGILWVTSNSGTPTPVADSLPNAAFVNDPAVVSDKRLDSPSIAITSPAAQLTFRQNYSFEGTTTFFDGGVLEISIGGGAFTDIITAGGSFVTGGYNATIDATFMPTHSLDVRRGAGTSAGFITTTVNLPSAAAGQNIVLRWRMGSDTSTAGVGWRVDSVVLSQPGACPAGSPTPTATATLHRRHRNSHSYTPRLQLRHSHSCRLRLQLQQRSRLLQQRLLQREPRLRRQHAHRA